MGGFLADHRVFWREFRQNFQTTGAIAPSGRTLAKALARFVDGDMARPQRILEVGPGTGAVTTSIVGRLGPEDRLDLVELNDRFVARLRERFEQEPRFQHASTRCRVLHQPVEQVSAAEPYDLLISGLPLNNFSVELVEKILAAFRRLVRPGGVISFFEYIAIRPARAVVSGRAERDRLRGIGRAMQQLLSEGEIRRDWILPNLPPAWVHHVRLPGN